jgi:hypothetical protein
LFIEPSSNRYSVAIRSKWQKMMGFIFSLSWILSLSSPTNWQGWLAIVLKPARKDEWVGIDVNKPIC